MIHNYNRIIIWGFGVEGRDTLRWVGTENFNGAVLVLDEKFEGTENTFVKNGATFTKDPGLLENLTQGDLVIKSPGISAYRPEYISLLERGIPITSNVDLAFNRLSGRICIGITGTKGKSTTAAMIFHILDKQGISAVLCGNYGVPLLGAIGNATSETVFVVELSSYQIFDLHNFPAIRLLTNISEDHLDWHKNTQNYRVDKLRLISSPTRGVSFINGADALSVDLTKSMENIAYYNTPKTIRFAEGFFFLKDTRLETPEIFKQEAQYFLSNICSALSVTAQLGVDPNDAIRHLSTFKGLRHRQEQIGTKDGIQFVNDSISTVPVATLAAIDRYAHSPIQLILGGYDRGIDYGAFISAIQSFTSVRAYCYGPAGKRMHDLLPENTYYNDAFTDVVTKAKVDAKTGDVVLLSPAAASYGDFANFQERGDRFAELCGLSA